jgi:electron transport complex protein RnfG
MNRYAVLLAAAVLCAFGVAGAALVSFTWDQTHERIAENEREALLRQLHDLVPADSIDNDIINDRARVTDPDLLGAPETTVYLGRYQGSPVAAVFKTVAPNGYSGPITLLVAVRRDGTLGGVRVIAHRETPGLGDKIELEKSDWVLAFNGKSLNNPPQARWKVRRDGGDFDQFTGATITPRIVVEGVKHTLIHYREAGEELFRQPPADREDRQ